MSALRACTSAASFASSLVNSLPVAMSSNAWRHRAQASPPSCSRRPELLSSPYDGPLQASQKHLNGQPQLLAPHSSLGPSWPATGHCGHSVKHIFSHVTFFLYLFGTALVPVNASHSLSGRFRSGSSPVGMMSVANTCHMIAHTPKILCLSVGLC